MKLSNKYTLRKIVSDEDFIQVEKLWKSKNTLMRQSVPFSITDTVRLGNIVGSFLNNEVVATGRYSLWKDLPCYQIGSIFIKPGLINNFSSPENPSIDIVDHILELMENQNFYSWYYVRPLVKAYARIQDSNYNLYEKHDFLKKTQLGYRYNRYIEEIITPGSLSKFDAFNRSLIGNRTWDNPIMIVKCCLKDEHRNIKEKFLNGAKNESV